MVSSSDSFKKLNYSGGDDDYGYNDDFFPSTPPLDHGK